MPKLKIDQKKIMGENSSLKVTPSVDLYFDKWIKRTVNSKKEDVAKTTSPKKTTKAKTTSPKKTTKAKTTSPKKTTKAKTTSPKKTTKAKVASKMDDEVIKIVIQNRVIEEKSDVDESITKMIVLEKLNNKTELFPAEKLVLEKAARDKKIEFIGITKRFGTNVANDNISFSVKENEVHALLGENGAGKSTLMSILFGLYKANSGTVKVNGKVQNIKNPRHANELKIAMLPQHFKLVENMSVLDNVILGYEKINKAKGKNFDVLTEIAEKFKLDIDLKAKVQDLSISDKQKVEILKILWRDAEIIIFDEPTSILTPQEIDNFMGLIKFLQKEGKTILIITHKLPEIKEVADRVSIIRKGKFISTKVVSKISEKAMAELMVGDSVDLNLSSIKRINSKKKSKVTLEVEDLSYKGTEYEQSLNNVSFKINEGEILGIAAIDGNGQSELLKSIAGINKCKGKVIIKDVDVSNYSVRDRFADRSTKDKMHHRNNLVSHISHIPEDRHKYGLILDYTVRKNSVLQDIDRYSTTFGFLKNKDIDIRLKFIKDKYDVRGVVTPKIKSRLLSGGNQQKLIIGREIERESKLLLAAHPTRGLDVGAIRNVYESIINARNKGLSVLLSSGELDEIMQVSDRIIVMRDGEIVSTSKRGELSKTELGSLMSGGK